MSSLQRGGSNPLELRGPSANAYAPPYGAGPHRDEEERQLGHELEQCLADAQDLRRLLDRNPTQMENPDEVIESLRRAGNYPKISDPQQIARLKAAIDYMRRVELDLAGNLERLDQENKDFSAEDNEVPGSFHKLVEEYFRAIAK